MIFCKKILIALKNRFWRYGDTIFLTETKLKNHTLLNVNKSDNFTVVSLNEFAKVTPLIYKRINESSETNKYIEIVRKRFKRGDSITLLYNNKLIMGYAFISNKYAELLQVRKIIKLPVNCAAVYDVYTFAEYRNKGIYKILISEIFKNFDNDGIEKIWLWVIPSNKLSCAVHTKLGIDNVIAIYREKFRFGFRISTRIKVNSKKIAEIL